MLNTNLPKTFSTDSQVQNIIHSCRCGYATTDAREAFRHRGTCELQNAIIDVAPLTLEHFKRSVR